LIFGAIVLFASGVSLWQTVRPVYFGRSVRGRGRDYLAWATPILHGIERDRGLADALELIAQAVFAGTPIVRVLTEATTLAINSALRRKFLTWAKAVSEGATIVDGARAAGMGDLVVGMLATAH